MSTARYINRCIAVIACALSVVTFTACDKDVHDNEYLPSGSSDAAFIVGVQSGTEPDCLTFYFFGSDGTTFLRKDYTDLRTPASEYATDSAGTYTIVAVANIAAADLPEETTVADLAEWLKENGGTYPNLLTAEVYKQGTTDCVHRRALLCTVQADGTYLAELSLLAGNYDLRLWPTGQATARPMTNTTTPKTSPPSP